MSYLVGLGKMINFLNLLNIFISRKNKNLNLINKLISSHSQLQFCSIFQLGLILMLLENFTSFLNL